MLALSPGAWTLVAAAVVAGCFVAARERPTGRNSLEMWMFSPAHRDLYRNSLGDDAEQVRFSLFGLYALRQRVMNGFFAGVRTADLVELERMLVGPVFSGPVEEVGLMDLTDRLREEGLLEEINGPSFSPWTSRGRVFGIPHDVHPVLLGYRADLIDAAGIDLSGVETWEDLGRALRPMTGDANGDGEPDRYALAFWPTQRDKVELLLLQGDGQMFDEHEFPTLDHPRNAELIARMVSWCVGPDRFAADVDDFTTASNMQKVEGYALCFLMPDWMCNIWKEQIPQLAGKSRLRELPAFEADGRHTSVWGGSMLGIPKTTHDPDAAWAIAKRLYLSDELARALYAKTDIVTPIRRHWSDPVFAEPDPFYCGQAKGLMYIEHAPDVPARTSSPLNRQAVYYLSDAAMGVLEYAERTETYDAASLEAEAVRQLSIVQGLLAEQAERNVFLGEGAAQ